MLVMFLCLLVLFTVSHLSAISVKYESSSDTNVTESIQNYWELGDELEGDILIKRRRRNVIQNPLQVWPNNTVPYEFDTIYDEDQKKWFAYALTQITNHSCVKTRLRTKEDKDYIFITEEKAGCSSYIGKIGGRQILNLKRAPPRAGCFNSKVIVHEFLHVLGFYHQHCVYNRDKYVTIYYDNIKEGKAKDFKTYPEKFISNMGEEYDYKSIMHYSSYAKSKNGKMTIVPKDPKVVITNNRVISEIDLKKLNKRYQCQ